MKLYKVGDTIYNLDRASVIAFEPECDKLVIAFHPVGLIEDEDNSTQMARWASLELFGDDAKALFSCLSRDSYLVS